MRSASEMDIPQESPITSQLTSLSRSDGRHLILRMSELPRLEVECKSARANARKLEDALEQANLNNLLSGTQTQVRACPFRYLVIS